MFLKRLQIYGFKSFADKTVMDFDSGVTALVGPNGCGKSNVVDAIRWALGEQSAKSLRGSEMVDLIFNGTATRRPLGFAQVSLIFDNTRRHLPVDADEVSVTRRLYRTGECEYQINGQVSRLRDIREMFMDTGVGVGAYSIIEQGRVDALLQASAKERRGIFEEAAGIAKYRSRKAAALRKLDRVDQNLLRIGDVITEVERQLRSVVRQAGKARRYRQLSEEMSQIRLTVLAADHRALSEKLSALRTELSAQEDRAAELAARGGRLEAEIVDAQAKSSELELASERAERRRAEDREKLATLRSEIGSARNMAAQHAAAAQRARQEAAELSERAATAQREESAAREGLSRVEAECAEMSSRLAATAEAVAGAVQRTADLSATIEQRKAQSIEVVRRRIGVDSELASMLSEQERLGTEIGRLEQETGVLRERLAAAQQELGHSDQRIAEIAARGEAVAGELERARAGELAATREAEEIDRQAGELTAHLSAVRSRRSLLSEHEARREGLGRGVRGLLEAMSVGSAPAGLCGVVADLVKVPEKLEVAIETALGSKVQNVVTTHTGAARDAVELLKRERLGRATFLPLDRVRDGRYRPNAETLSEPGVIGRAADLVEFEGRYRPVFEYLLGSTLVVNDLDSAMRVANNGARDGLVVTLEGEIFYPSGAITGGAYRARPPGLISRRNELIRLDEEINDAEADLTDLALRKREVTARRSQLVRRRDDLLTERHGLENSELRLRDGQELVRRDASRFSEELGLLDRDLEESGQRRGELQAKIEEARRRGELLAGEEESISRDLEEMSASLRTAEAERADLREKHTGLKVAGAQLEASRASLEGRAEMAARHLAERRQEATARRGAAEEAEESSRSENRRAESLENQLSAAVGAAQEAEEAGTRLQARREELREMIRRAQGAERECRGEADRVNEEVGKLRLAESEAGFRLEGVLERARAEGETDLGARAADLDAEALDLEALRTRLQEGDERLRKMGEVNLSAITEEDALRARRAELKTQQADLEEARKLLRDAIGRINRISRERFRTTFDQVREHFADTYRKLFGGGKADIFLEDDQDVLEAGIEIVARPPGKDLRKLSLLSGGERTLTTIALLFAIFKAKPSPFCVLDEVDAPLDESNIDRFMLVLREFLEQSQFLIITHNRRTMADADVIYGVTMQESGVSKRIAVRFEEVGDDLAVA
jgi:chromosome segregation protein